MGFWSKLFRRGSTQPGVVVRDSSSGGNIIVVDKSGRSILVENCDSEGNVSLHASSDSKELIAPSEGPTTDNLRFISINQTNVGGSIIAVAGDVLLPRPPSVASLHQIPSSP